MSDYSAVAPPPQQNFGPSSAFAAALQRAKQIAAKINPGSTNPADNRPKRPLEDGPEPDAKKGPSNSGPPPQLPPPGNRPPPSQGGMGGPPMGGGPQLNEDIKVPDKMVGLIIGRGGEQITRLQSESGCKIQMAPDSQGMPDRVCSLSGTKEAINRAKELIMNIVHQRGRTEGLGGLDLGPNMGHNNYPGMNNMNQGMGGGSGGGGGGGGGGRNFVEIMIPGPKVGLIIGKGGETIKQLQEKSGAKMVVIQDGPNQEQEKPLRISGDPSKVEYAKQLVYDLIAEKEMQNYNRRGGGGRQDDRQQYNDYGGGGGNEAEVLVPRQAVGVVIGKGGDMIKKIQAETGARVQFQQAREEGPGERRCYLSGTPKQVEQARQRIEELIDSVHRRDGGDGPGQGRGRGRGGDRYDSRGGSSRNGGGQEYGGWDDRRQQQPPQEVTFVVPSSKCGVIIGRGGETIKQINQQSGAHCELDRRSQNNQNSNEKTFIIRGDPDQIEAAKRIISDKVQMPLNFVPVGGPAMSNNMQTAYPGMAPQAYNPQNWGMPAYQQQWNAPSQSADAPTQQNTMQVNPSTGQPDYSLQWAEYYRSLGMHREAEMIEQQAKSKGMSTAPGQPQAGATAGSGSAPAATPTAAASNGGQPDYSAQWAEYYRSIGKHKEAEAIEAQMKSKQQSQANVQSMQGGPASSQSGPVQAPAGSYQQQAYGAYQASSGYYGGQAQGGVPGNVPQGGYGFPAYGYGAPAPAAPPNNSEN
ncbi:far upstream element-binding protein 1 isoform X2 [Tribolium madens]|uniref:far upstream element-binding protein 1 isoform X2 n=1 Tax=Tribolium madens TaxID=41895 RepID=UPI001CF72084|nr:far upstream element-binding protein 1 isoform X2 [Tribolium madens]